MQDVLLLNADHAPVRIVDWRRAVILLLEGRAQLVERYPDRVIRSARLVMPWPAVVALMVYARVPHRLRLDRRAVFSRDDWTCQYCGFRARDAERPAHGLLTLDHVVPRARARGGFVPGVTRKVPVTSWENVVACCVPCNRYKGNRTPDEAGMTLLKPPRSPRPDDHVRIALGRAAAPPEWGGYLAAPERFQTSK